ncbi:hypothetical protein AOC36_02440 [Erysipelothrix larvae]|uniref:D-alanyl-D-alanine carboxypeptidase-like core domain-containing protein n=1 Tax=Erysipelothrix larvae TaxID=1514105 RepID=A0A120JTH2_9FIRM|nr:M15 family metallopeptidase [Erysipelothrix larvae]AMC92880.1 hypothetical protein AOC36_02440 [Erysipelothrix larvae]
MKRFFIVLLTAVFVLSGCSKDQDSINKNANITFIGEAIEVGTTLSDSFILNHIESDGVVENTDLSVLFENGESQFTFNEEGTIKVTIRLTHEDDVLDKTISIDVKDTQAPFIIGAFDREVALNETVDLNQLVSTRNPNDSLEFSPSTVDTSTYGTTTVSVSAYDGHDRVSTEFEIIVTDFSSKSDFRFFGQTYGNLVALNKNTNLVLVNKRFGLGESYTPKNLVTIDDEYAFQQRQGIQVVQEAYEAFVALNAAMIEETSLSPLSISTAYRSYSFQSTLYNNYVQSDGIEAADTYSARPGFSEHQTGLALDIAADNKNLDAFGETQQAQYVKENAARFGFIIRFPQGKDRITGYQHESWHIRYVGVEYASLIEASGLTLDQYIFAHNLTDIQ